MTFDNTSTGEITSTEWDLGGGDISSDVSPSHEFTLAGSYAVSLTVTGPGGSDTVTLVDAFTVLPGPAASLEPSSEQIDVAAGESLELSALVFDEFRNEVDAEVVWTAAYDAGMITDSGAFTATTTAGLLAGAVNASISAGDVVTTIAVLVLPGPLHEVAISPEQSTMPINSVRRYELTATDEYGNEVTEFIAVWSLGSDIGAISESGDFVAATLAGEFPGSIRVDALQGGTRLTFAADVTIEPGPLAEVLVQPSVVLLDIGAVQSFEATGFDRYHNEIPELVFLWESTGGEINQDGLFTATQGPTHKITAFAAITSIQITGSAEAIMPLGHWPGDPEGTDVAGSNRAILENGATFVPGLVGQAFRLDGRNDHVSLSRQPAITHGFTFSTWVNFNGSNLSRQETIFNNNQLLLRKTESTKQIGAYIKLSDRQWQAAARSATTPVSGEWMHVAVTWDGSILKIFINGTFEDRVIVEGTLSNYPKTVSRWYRLNQKSRQASCMSPR